jgi:hypothetical protein
LINRSPEIGTGQPGCQDDLTVPLDGMGVICAVNWTEVGIGLVTVAEAEG